VTIDHAAEHPTPPPRLRTADFLLLRIDALGILNALRRLAQIPWPRKLWLTTLAAIIIYYGTLLIISELQIGARLAPHHAAMVLTTILLFSLLIGITAGRNAAQRRQRMIGAPWLAILPLSNRQIARSIRTALIADAITHAALFTLLLATLPKPPQIIPTGTMPAACLITFLAAFAIAARQAAPRTSSSPRTTIAAPNPLPRPLEPLDSRRPAHLGAWALQPRLRPILTALPLSFIVSVGVATAAAQAAAAPTVAPALAIIMPVTLLIIALETLPILSPVLRTSPLGYRHAVIALLRLPIVLAASWLALFDALAHAARWMSPPLIGFTLIAALGLGTLYALTALSLPRSGRSAVAFYLIALLLVGDQYAELQNFGFLIMALILLPMALRARAAYRHGD
jgi:hypothetical protein